MQQGGSLRKRRPHTLAKVHGLSTIPYDEALDVFNGLNYNTIQTENAEENGSSKFSASSGLHTKLIMSSKEMAEYRRNSNVSGKKRVTRDPSFHTIDHLENYEDNLPKTPEKPIQKPDQNSQYPSHFLNDRTIQRLKQIVFCGTIFGLFPWKWNEKKYRIDRRSSLYTKLWLYPLHFSTVQSIFLACYQFNRFFRNFYSETMSNRTAFMGCFGLLWNCNNIAKNLVIYFHEEQIRQYINKMLRLNQVYVDKYLIHLDNYQYRGGVIVSHVFLFFHVAQIVSSVSLFIRKPFLSQYLFSFIYPKPWYWLIPGAFHQLWMLGQIVIYLLFVPWIVMVHTNTLRFWLREIHNNNDSDYTSDELRKNQNALKAYKSLEVLNMLFNECMAPLAIPAAQMTFACGIVPIGYVLIRSMNHFFIDDFPGILSFPVGMVNVCIKASLLLSMSAEVSDLGYSFLDSWSLTKDKDFRRILISCPTLKIWTRRFYFITVSTTITFFQEATNIITDCVMTFP